MTTKDELQYEDRIAAAVVAVGVDLLASLDTAAAAEVKQE